MATVNKNFRIKNGLVVEGSTATVNGQNVLTETGGDNYILNLIGGETLVKSVASGLSVDGAGELSINRTIVDGWYDANGAAATAQSNAEDYADGLASNYDPAGSASTAQSNAETFATNAINALDTDDIEEGATNLYFTNQRALDATSSAYDAAGAASTAQSNAETFATNAINALDTDDIEEGITNQYFTNQRALDATSAAYDPAGSAATAQSNAEDYADSLINDSAVQSTNVWSAYKTSSEIDTAINNLIDGAPGLLNTLNEIAAAINDDENYFTTVTNAINAKQDTLTAGSNIDITGSTISVTGLDTNDVSEGTNLYFTNQRALDATASAYDASGSASTAQTNAENYADGLVDDVLDATTAFTAINLNSVAKEVAATATIASAGSANAITWSASAYRTAKALVKFETATHSQVSEVLLTLDAANNVAITEYAEVGTNGSLGTVSASYTSGTVAITVTTVNANTDVMVKATLLA